MLQISKAYVPVYQSAWHHNPVDHNLNPHPSENIRS